ncbi:MAG: prolipoprotein diacylglyceryl transferase [Chlamydiota bacterium]
MVIGGLLGARLGDLLFYQNAEIWLSSPLSLIKIWEGGLSSHGGAIGVLSALYLFSRRFKKSFLELLDCIVIPVVLAAPFIRIGNFFNQEILGTASTLPWAVVFMHPADGSAAVPRHPAQLYEALCYLIIWVVLMKKKAQFRGHISGLFLILVFGSRLLIECVKNEQSVYLSSSFLTMGQYLSLPLIILGIYLLIKGLRQQEPQAPSARSDRERHDHIEDKS